MTNSPNDAARGIKRDHEKDMKTLAGLFFGYLQLNDVEFGGWGIDGKRPFGNSDVESDILEELRIEPDDPEGEWFTEEQREYARTLYADLGRWLRVQWQDKWNKSKLEKKTLRECKRETLFRCQEIVSGCVIDESERHPLALHRAKVCAQIHQAIQDEMGKIQ